MQALVQSTSAQVQTSRKRRYLSDFYGFGIVELPANLKFSPKYLSEQNLPSVCGGTFYWDSSNSEADGYVTSKKRRRLFGKGFAKSNELLMKEIENYQNEYRHLLEIPEDQICIRDSSLDKRQTALNCLSMSPIFGKWKLEPWKNFQVECIDKAERDITKFRFLPAITGKSAFEFAAYHGLDKICWIIWQILRDEDHTQISTSNDQLISQLYWQILLEKNGLQDFRPADLEIMQQVPEEEFQQGPAAKRSRYSVNIAEDFVNILELVGNAEIPIVAMAQEENIVALVHHDDYDDWSDEEGMS